METIKRMMRQWATERVRMEIIKLPHAGYGDVAFEVRRLDDVAQWVTAAPVWQWRKRLKVAKAYNLSCTISEDLETLYKWLIEEKA